MAPAAAILGKAVVVIVILEVEAAQGAFVIDQVKTLVPAVNPVIVVTGEEGVVITPLPETFIHTPTPVTAGFPAIVTEPVLRQIVWLGPAAAAVGGGFPVIVTCDTEVTHGKLIILHLKTLAPIPKPVIVVVGDNEFVMVPAPEIKIHEPVPITGLLAAIVAVAVVQTV